MNNSNNQEEPKKKFPGGLLLFIMAAVLIILTVHNLSSEKGGKVAFSHQAEHLVNLDLIHKGQSHKTAQNDNLVSFS